MIFCRGTGTLFYKAFARRNFYEDTRLDISSAARFLLKK